MAEKIASGAWHEGGPELPGPDPDSLGPPSPADAARDAEVERLKAKRDNARWSAIVGFAMMFAGGFHTGILIGGLLMTLYGATMSVWWSRRMAKVKGDPWEYDPELDGPQAPDWARR